MYAARSACLWKAGVAAAPGTAAGPRRRARLPRGVKGRAEPCLHRVARTSKDSRPRTARRSPVRPRRDLEGTAEG
eukprot:9138189-Alexandrium_andersonii.AAC.1